MNSLEEEESLKQRFFLHCEFVLQRSRNAKNESIILEDVYVSPSWQPEKIKPRKGSQIKYYVCAPRPPRDRRINPHLCLILSVIVHSFSLLENQVNLQPDWVLSGRSRTAGCTDDHICRVCPFLSSDVNEMPGYLPLLGCTNFSSNQTTSQSKSVTFVVLEETFRED